MSDFRPISVRCAELWPGNWRHSYNYETELSYGDIVIKVSNLNRDHTTLQICGNTLFFDKSDGAFPDNISEEVPGETIEEQFKFVKRRLRAVSVCIAQIIGECPACNT